MVYGVWKEAILHDVLFVPYLAYNLISISQAQRTYFRVVNDGYKSQPRRGLLLLFHNPSRNMKMTAVTAQDGLLEAIVRVQVNEAHAAQRAVLKTWHQRMGHCGCGTLKASFPRVNGIREK